MKSEDKAQTECEGEKKEEAQFKTEAT